MRDTLLPRLAVFLVLLMSAAGAVAQVGQHPPAFIERAPLGLLVDGTSSQGEIGLVVAGPALAMFQGEATTTQVLGGSALGFVAGGAIGAGLGYLIYEMTDPPDADMFGGLFSVTAGAALGAAARTYLGVRWAGDGQGDPWLTAAGSLVGVAAGIGLGVLAGDATDSTALGIIVAVPIAITLPVLVDMLTRR